MIQTIYTVVENTLIARGTYKMRLSGDTGAITAPGQFINIRLDGRYLRRPISVHDVDGGTVTIIYKVVGGGTEQMAHMRRGVRLDVLTGLGNGFDTSKSGDSPLLLGGGAGVAPLYMLAKKLVAEGKRPSAVLGFGSAGEVFGVQELLELGVPVTVTTNDGSAGVRGFVTDAMPEGYTYTYVCGPEPMMRAVYKKASSGGQYSFEARMGCGFGACLGCSCKTVTGYKRICKDGPVLEREEILWTD